MKKGKQIRKLYEVLFPKKALKAQEEETYGQLRTFLSARNAQIVSFEYYGQIFGDIVLTIRYKDTSYEFITEKGDIYFNGQLACDSSYHIKGRDDTVSKLIDVITEKLFSGNA